MKFRFSGTLLRFTDYNKEIELPEALSINAALERLFEQHPDLRSIVLDAHGGVRSVMRVFLNRVQIDTITASTLDRPLQPDDEVELLTAIAGG